MKKKKKSQIGFRVAAGVMDVFGVAAAALPLLKAGQTCPPQALDVFYLRRPQAERERLKRLSGQQ